jgi:uncharacterized PurR-regulated membrane protein YhhQ (DUF165 family)
MQIAMPYIQLGHLKYTLLYIGLIPAVNMLLPVLPLLDLGEGTKFTPVSFLVGAIYVVRDFAQREIGRRRIFLAMGVAAILTYVLASPAQAAASLLAFLCGELADWGVYTFTRRPMSQRVLISSMLALPVDITVVLMGFQVAMPGFLAFNLTNMGLMFASNMVAALALFLILRRQERQGRSG